MAITNTQQDLIFISKRRFKVTSLVSPHPLTEQFKVPFYLSAISSFTSLGCVSTVAGQYSSTG